MGNRALRVKLARRLKELGLGKLYCGDKRVAHRRLYAGQLKELLWKLSFAPGDLANDCDGFNWVVIRWLTGHSSNYGYNRGWDSKAIQGWVFETDQFEKGDNWWSCGCPGSPSPAWTQEQVEQYMKAWANDPSQSDWTEGPYYDAVRAAFKAGEHVTDAQGRLLPKYVELRRAR